MSNFLSIRHKNLVPYVPGEQPKDQKYIKLNTNESPYPPSDRVIKAAGAASEKLNLYSDPEILKFRLAFAKKYGLTKDNIIATNGSDEVLDLAFNAFTDDRHPLVFPDITYGFYPVFAEKNRLPYSEIPLDAAFKINVSDYIGIGKNIVIANPNAPTGEILSIGDIETIVKSNPDNIVIIDEAYVDFGAESAVALIGRYNNLLVTQTFSKSRSLAGARLGVGIACPELIADLNTLRYSTNPYNVNSMTESCGVAAMADNNYYMNNCKEIIKTREYTASKLKEFGFTMTDSYANFLFAKTDKISGEALYLKLKEKGILIRHFTKEKIKEYNRITIGTRDQMDAFLSAVGDVLSEV